MTILTENDFVRALYLKAELTITDIRNDREADGDHSWDYGFECYADQIPIRREWDFGRGWIGVVYAGELGTWWFAVNESSDDLEQVWVSDEDAVDLLPRVFGSHGIYGLVG